MNVRHYSSQIMRDKFKALKAIDFNANPSSDQTKRLASLYLMLDNSIKFYLPDGGKILSISRSEEQKAMQEFGRLPYENIAIEYLSVGKNTDWGPYKRIGAEIECPERVLLCQEIEPEKILITFFTKMLGFWAPYEASIIYFAKSSWSYIVPNYGDPSLFAPTDTQKNIMANYSDELGIVANLIAALECQNIVTSQTRIPKSVNSRRTKRKKRPLYSYHVLEILPSPTRAGPSGGAHSSPRVHLRRGHIRRLGEGRKIWVNAAVVGSKSAGIVHKDYGVSVRNRSNPVQDGGSPRA